MKDPINSWSSISSAFQGLQNKCSMRTTELTRGQCALTCHQSRWCPPWKFQVVWQRSVQNFHMGSCALVLNTCSCSESYGKKDSHIFFLFCATVWPKHFTALITWKLFLWKYEKNEPYLVKLRWNAASNFLLVKCYKKSLWLFFRQDQFIPVKSSSHHLVFSGQAV